MAHNINGDGLRQLHKALEELVANPKQLRFSRERFSRITLVSYTMANCSTLSGSPASPEALRLEEERILLRVKYIQAQHNRLATLPSEQFRKQINGIEITIREACRKNEFCLPAGTNYDDFSQERIKKEWVEQGIWKDSWDDVPTGSWKHEEPLDIGPEVKVEVGSPDEATSSQKESERESTRAAMRRAKLVRDHEASRPFHQFVYQVSKAGRRIQAEINVKDGCDRFPDDIGTKAYQSVKDEWIANSIWDTDWGVMPGMSWKHEKPLEDVIDDDLIAFAKADSFLMRDFLRESTSKSSTQLSDQSPVANEGQIEAHPNATWPEEDFTDIVLALSPATPPEPTGNKPGSCSLIPPEQTQNIEKTPSIPSSTRSLPCIFSDPIQSVREVGNPKSAQFSPRKESNTLRESLHINILRPHQREGGLGHRTFNVASQERKPFEPYRRALGDGEIFIKDSLPTPSLILSETKSMRTAMSTAGFEDSWV